MLFLWAARYDNDDSTPSMLEYIGEPANVGIRASLPGWVKTTEITIRAKSRADAYERYRTHLGQRMAVGDNAIDQPITEGRIYEIVPDGRHVHYICAGPWKEHERELDVTSYTATDTLASVITDILTDHVAVLSSDKSNIDANSTQIGSVWNTKASTGGITPADAITEILDMSDSSGNVWDYWCVPEPFNGVSLGQYLPYYKARSTTAAINWQCELADLKQLSMSRHIWNLARDVTVYYGSSPTATASSVSTEADLWTVEKAPRKERFALTQANQTEDKYLSIYEQPIQQQDFSIGAGTIRDAAGAQWPLWELIKRGPGYIRINDLYPTAALLDVSTDRLRTFFIAALDYDYSSNTLRVVPDNPDTRLDAVLAREVNMTEVKGEMVQRYEPTVPGVGNRR